MKKSGLGMRLLSGDAVGGRKINDKSLFASLLSGGNVDGAICDFFN